MTYEFGTEDGIGQLGPLEDYLSDPLVLTPADRRAVAHWYYGGGPGYQAFLQAEHDAAEAVQHQGHVDTAVAIEQLAVRAGLDQDAGDLLGSAHLVAPESPYSAVARLQF